MQLASFVSTVLQQHYAQTATCLYWFSMLFEQTQNQHLPAQAGVCYNFLYGSSLGKLGSNERKQEKVVEDNF